MKTYDRHLVLGLLMYAACIFLAGFCAQHADSQDRYSVEAHALGRVCISERDWEVQTSDCAMFNAVFEEQAARRGETFLQRVYRYSSHSHPGQERAERPWVRYLRLDARRPPMWPRSVRWAQDRPDGTNARQAWLETLEEARRLRDGLEPNPCAEPVFHWGGPVVDAHRIAEGKRRRIWHQVDCGDTLNVPLGPGGPTRAVPEDQDAS